MKKFVEIFTLTLVLLSGFYFGTKFNSQEESVPENERKFELFADVKLFQFTGENLTPAQIQLNKALLDIREKVVSDFYDEIKIFFEPDFEEVRNYISGVALNCKVVQNTDKIFSCEIETEQYHHGANGCHSGVIGVNYALENGKIWKIKFAELFKSKSDKIAFLKKALSDIKKRTTGLLIEVDTLSEKDLEEIESQLQFVFSDNKIKIMFPPYTIACGACGVLKSEQNYTKD